MTPVTITVNDTEHVVDVHDGELLIETLRALGCTSVRGTCGIGVCGTCTVHVDGAAASACLLLTEQVVGREVRTSEGLVGPRGELDEVQAAFVRHQAYQCSFCIPGMVMTLRALLDREAQPSVTEAREELGGNLCRCGTYPSILAAVQALTDAPVDAEAAPADQEVV